MDTGIAIFGKKGNPGIHSRPGVGPGEEVVGTHRVDDPVRRHAGQVRPLAAADLFESAGLTHSTGTGRGFSQVSALFAFSIIAIAARRMTTGQAPRVDIDPANRVRVLCIVTSVALCSAIPLADAWSSGRRDLSTLLPGACVLEIGCGTGLLTEMLVARGLRVEAVDPGPSMVDAARRRVGDADVRFHLGRFEDVDRRFERVEKRMDSLDARMTDTKLELLRELSRAR